MGYNAAILRSKSNQRSVSFADTYVIPGNVFYQVAKISLKGLRKITLTAKTGGPGNITGLKLSAAPQQGGNYAVVFADEQFSTIPGAIGLDNPTNLPPGSEFIFSYEFTTNDPQFSLFAKSDKSATIAIAITAA